MFPGGAHPYHQHQSRHHGSGSGSASTQLDFNEAMTDFKVMFPDMDADVIEAVLRANNGAVDATIDHLLAMSADNERQVAPDKNDDKPPDYSQNPPSYSQATKRKDPDEGNLINFDDDDDDEREEGDEEEEKKKDDMPDGKTLPTTFSSKKDEPVDYLSDMNDMGAAAAAVLDEEQYYQHSHPKGSPKHAYTNPKRQSDPPRYASQQSTSTSYVPTQQMLQDRYEENLRMREEARSNPDQGASRLQAQLLEDERLALMLQNEEFIQELRSDREFMSTLAAESDIDTGYYGQGIGSKKAHPSGTRSKAMMMMMDEALFKEKLKTMGKSSKKKFTQLAHMFSRRKGPRQLLGHAPDNLSKDNLLLNDEPLIDREYDELSGDDDDDKKSPSKAKYKSFS